MFEKVAKYALWVQVLDQRSRGVFGSRTSLVLLMDAGRVENPEKCADVTLECSLIMVIGHSHENIFSPVGKNLFVCPNPTLMVLQRSMLKPYNAAVILMSIFCFVHLTNFPSW